MNHPVVDSNEARRIETWNVALAEALEDAGNGDMSYPNTLLYDAAKKREAEVVRKLLSAGADPNWLHEEANDGPLHVAAASGHVENVRALLAAGAQIDLRAHHNMTPLMYAIASEVAAKQYKLPTILALIEAGADLNAACDLYPYVSVATCALRRGKRRILLTLLRAGATLQPDFELSFSARDLGFGVGLSRGRIVVNSITKSCEHFFELGEMFEVAWINRQRVPPIVDESTLSAFESALQKMSRPVRIVFSNRSRYSRDLRNSSNEHNNESVCALVGAIDGAFGDFNVYARRQRKVHIAILTKCVADALPLDVKTFITTFLWLWGGA
jgi:hypothetical protein